MHYPFWQSETAQYYGAPAEIRRLPFTLLRSHLYPSRYPGKVAQAARSYTEGAPLPIAYLPQRMAFTRYKTPPSPRAYGENIRGLMDALGGAHAQWRALYDRSLGYGHVPVQSLAQAASRYDHLPVPALDPNIRDVPVGRNSLPQNRIGQGLMDPRQLDDLFVRENRVAQASAMVRQVGRETALSEVSSVRSGLRSLVAQDPRALPWFLR